MPVGARVSRAHAALAAPAGLWRRGTARFSTAPPKPRARRGLITLGRARPRTASAWYAAATIVATVINVFIVLACVAALVYEVYKRRERDRKLLLCGEQLGITGFKHTASSITGVMRGRPISVQFQSGGKSSPASTSVEVDCAPCRVLLHLRKADDSERTLVERGHAKDLPIGDPAFDEAWIVEGAPDERVRRILSDPALRARIKAFHSCTAPSVQIEDGKVLVYHKNSDFLTSGVVTDRIELAVALALAAVSDAETPLLPGEVETANYRSIRRADPEADAEAQIVQLKEIQATRAILDVRSGVIAAFSITTVLIVAFQWSEVAPIATTGLLVFTFFVAIALGRQYFLARRKAPWLPHDRWAFGWSAACLAIDAALALRQYLKM